MKEVLIFLVSTLLLATSNTAYAKNSIVTETVIKEKIIKESIENYPGPCACPYNTAKNGSRCGKRSAYSRAGGYETVCYKSDVTTQMIQDYKSRNKR